MAKLSGKIALITGGNSGMGLETARLFADTPIMSKMGLTEDQAHARRQSFAKLVPLGRMGRSEEIATTALFLASDDSSFVTGIDLAVDAGMAQV